VVLSFWGRTMLTWQIDRIFRAGPLCAVASLLLPLSMAILVHSQRGAENVLGILLVASGIVFIGGLVGSMLTSGLGSALFAVGTIVAEVPVILMAVVGNGLYITLVLHDLAGTFRRGPRINPAIWRDTAITSLALTAVSTVTFAVIYGVGGLATWQAIVVPFAIAAIGFAAKLAADAHRASARQLTARRPTQPDEPARGNDSSN